MTVEDGQDRGRARRSMTTVCATHALHDGWTDLLYVMLPVWQAEFGLSYAAAGLLRGVFSATMAGFQVPSTVLAERIGTPLVLALGTGLTALAFLAAGATAGYATLLAALVVGGLGSSVQHPLGAAVVAGAFEGKRSRVALGTFNFAGDLGKMALPAVTGLLIVWLQWRPTMGVVGAIGLAAAVAVLLALPRSGASAAPAPGAALAPATAVPPRRRSGLPLLVAIGVVDSATRMGFLAFLPFLLTAKGASVAMVGGALTLVFVGGAAGKLVCGWLGARFGVVGAVFLTEGLTAAGILALLPLPLVASLVLLPVIGVALNGTSSVLYGTVPELVTPERRGRAFGVFYTFTIGAGGLAPPLYGLLGDTVGVTRMLMAIAVVVLATLPLTMALRPSLRD